MHPCEPKLDELVKIKNALLAEPETNDKKRKLAAIEMQIKRNTDQK